MRDVCGANGATTLMVTWAEHWARHGHRVSIVANHIAEESYRGVAYVSWPLASPMKADVAVVFPSDIGSARAWLKMPRERIVCLNQGAPMDDRSIVTYLQPSRGTLYPYVYDGDVVPYRDRTKVSCVFFARPERGFALCERVAMSLPECVLYCNTYEDSMRSAFTPNDRVILVSGAASSKREVYGLLAKSKYFIYPWVATSGWAYNVAEALAHGVVVIAPRCALYETLFGDAICYVEMDASASDDVVAERFVHTLCDLESNDDLTQTYVRRGLHWLNSVGVPRLDDNLLHWIRTP
jgi:hypothetical protein